MSICGIYRITNQVNGKYYIGSSKDIAYRWQTHKQALNKGNHKNYHLQHAWAKYGESSFAFDVVRECAEQELFGLEQEMLDAAFATDSKKLYNIAPHAGGGAASEESRVKISKAMKGRVFSEEHRRKISLCRKGSTVSKETREKIAHFMQSDKNPHLGRTGPASALWGRKHTEETKQKMAQAQLGERHPMWGRKGEANPRFGMKHSEETKALISEKAKSRDPDTILRGENHPAWGKPGTNKGKKLSSETKRKISEARFGKYAGEDNAFYGKHHTEETKAKFQESQKKRRPHLARPVAQISLSGECLCVFPCAKDAAESMKMDISYITRVCNGYRNKAAGFKWQYAD